MIKKNKWEKAEWKINTPNFLNDIIMNSFGGMDFIRAPMNIFKQFLSELSDLSIEIDDPRLNLLMCRMALYGSGDPNSKDYDKDIFDKLRKQISEMKESDPA